MKSRSCSARSVVLFIAFLIGSATVARADSISLAWDPSEGAGGYVLHYGTASGGYTSFVDVGNQTTYTLSGLTAGTRYFFAVVAYSIFGTSAFSNEVDGVPGFTDSTLTSGVTTIKAVHVLELRQHIDVLRARVGLPAQAWTDSPQVVAPRAALDTTLTGTLIRAVHITELRAALAEVYQRLDRPLPTYTDSNLAPGSTVVKAIHITELRQAVLAVE